MPVRFGPFPALLLLHVWAVAVALVLTTDPDICHEVHAPKLTGTELGCKYTQGKIYNATTDRLENPTQTGHTIPACEAVWKVWRDKADRQFSQAQSFEGRSRSLVQAVCDFLRTRARLGNPEVRELVKLRARTWQEENRSRKAEISRGWAATHRESTSEAVRRWNAAHPDRVRTIKRNAQQRRRAFQEGLRRSGHDTRFSERDGWECQLPVRKCPTGRAIDPVAEYRWR